MVGVPKGVVGVPCMCRTQPQRKPPPGAMPRPARRCKPQRRSSTRSTPGLRRRATELRRRRPTWTSLPSRRMAHAVHCAVHMLLHAHCSPVPDLTANRSLPRLASAPTTASAPVTASVPITAAACLRLHPCALHAASLHAPASALHLCCLCLAPGLAPCLRPAPQPPPMPPPITAAASAPSALHTTSTKTVTSLGRSR